MAIHYDYFKTPITVGCKVVWVGGTTKYSGVQGNLHEVEGSTPKRVKVRCNREVRAVDPANLIVVDSLMEGRRRASLRTRSFHCILLNSTCTPNVKSFYSKECMQDYLSSDAYLRISEVFPDMEVQFSNNKIFRIGDSVKVRDKGDVEFIIEDITEDGRRALIPNLGFIPASELYD